MPTWQFELASPPDEARARALWLQHAAGFLLFEDARQYARDRLDPNLSDAERAVAEKAIDDTLYGLMMILDGVSGALQNATHHVELRTQVCLVRGADHALEEFVDLAMGDGMCQGFHGWREGDFGRHPVAARRA